MVKASVHYRENPSFLCNNSWWNGTQIFFCDGNGIRSSPWGDSLDMVAHEFTHGVTAYEARLVYSNQSGALNESYSDVFGAMVDREDWLILEDSFTPNIPGDALRSLENPPAFNSPCDSVNHPQPAHMRNYVNCTNTEPGDWGGVHLNSGIPNHAAYRIASVIGREKTEQIYYKTLIYYLTATSQFIDARNSTIHACENSVSSPLSTVCNAVQDGFAAVGLGFYSTTSTWIDATLGTHILSNLNCGDDCSVTINFPADFNFSFYGNKKTSLLVSDNGYVTFGTAGDVWQNTSVPNSNGPNDLIAAYWDDFHIGGIGSGVGVYYQFTGIAPNRTLTIQWERVPLWYGGGWLDNATFQVQLHETSYKIDFLYKDLYFGSLQSGYNYGASATVGIENSDGTIGYQYSFNTPSVYPSKFNIIYDLNLENEVRETGEVIVYEANNSITAGSGFTVESGANVTFKAGSRIHLAPGFRAKEGSFFRAKIGG